MTQEPCLVWTLRCHAGPNFARQLCAGSSCFLSLGLRIVVVFLKHKPLHSFAQMALAQAVACLLAAAVLALTLVWILYYDEGISLHRSRSGHTGAIFNLHPLFMTLAYVVAMPLAALQYRHPIARAWR